MTHNLTHSLDGPTLQILDALGEQAEARIGLGRLVDGTPTMGVAIRESVIGYGTTVGLRGDDVRALLIALTDYFADLDLRDPDLLENHGAQFVDADGDLWLFNGHTNHWYVAGNLRTDPEFVADSAADVLSPVYMSSIYEGFEAVHKVMANHGMAALR